MIRKIFSVALTIFAFGPICLAEQAQTMRVDFYHTGNRDTEMFSLDQVVLEPLPFPGNMLQPLDSTYRGKYAYAVVDPDSGDIAWSCSFSSIYGEWDLSIGDELHHVYPHERFLRGLQRSDRRGHRRVHQSA